MCWLEPKRALCLLMLMVWPATAQAAEAPASASFVVTSVHASRSEAPEDPALSKLSPYLSKSFKRYKSFKKLNELQLTSKRDKTVKGKIPGNKTLQLTYIKTAGGFVHVKLQMDGLTTTIRVRDGGLFFHAGRKHEDGILILAIRAKSN